MAIVVVSVGYTAVHNRSYSGARVGPCNVARCNLGRFTGVKQRKVLGVGVVVPDEGVEDHGIEKAQHLSCAGSGGPAHQFKATLQISHSEDLCVVVAEAPHGLQASALAGLQWLSPRQRTACHPPV